ncbi:MAG: MFS transporter [Candidatus Niyogibacteria bacterium]|nr:MFS transporter [Candidatus Niyogibacteria bacterium]
MRLFHFSSTFPRDLFSLPIGIKRLSIVMFLYYISWGVMDPFMPIYFDTLFGSYTSVGIVFALLYFFSVFLSLPFGDLSDIVSKRTLMKIILVLYLPLGPLISIVRTMTHVIFFRAYHAFLATGLWASAEAYVRSHSPEKQSSESMGLFDTAIGLATFVGAILGGILVTVFGIPIVFYIMPLFVFAALCAIFFLPDHEGSPSFIAGVKQLFRKRMFRFEINDFFSLPGIRRITLLSFLFNAASIGTMVLLPLVYRALGASFWEIGLIYAVFMLPSLFEAPFSVLADHVDKKFIFIFGALVAVVIQLSMAMIHGVIPLFILSLFLGIFFSLLRPCIEGAVTHAMPRERIGELNGVYRSFLLIASAAGSFAIGPVADAFTIQAAFLVGAILMAVFFFAALFHPAQKSIH